MSKKLQPAAFTSTRSAPGRGEGSGASPSRSSSGSQRRSTTMARMAACSPGARKGPYASSGPPAEIALLPRSLALALSTSLALACATTPPAPVETGQLFLWEVARPDGAGGVAHLLGTVHLSEDELHFDPAVASALDASDTLVLEIAPQDMEPASLLAVAVEKGHFRDGSTLDRVVA